MKLVKNFALALLLASFLAISAPAGELGTPGAVATPSPTPANATSTVTEEVVYYGDPNAGTTETSDYLFFEALAALLSLY